MFGVFFIVFSCSVFAQTVTWDPVVNLSNTMSATSDYHAVYSKGFSGQYLLAWGDNGEIKYRFSGNSGVNWNPTVIISTTPDLCGWPSLAGVGSRISIAYHTLRSGGNYEIIFQHSTDFGLTWSPMKKISGSASAITPQLIQVDSTIYCVWEERPNNNYEIYFSRSTDYGNTWTNPLNLSNTTTTSRWVQLYADRGNLYCAWLESPTYPQSDIYFIRSTDKGNSWSTPINITNDVRPQNRIMMKADMLTGRIVIASEDIITFNFNEIYLIMSDDYGVTWTTPKNITNNSGNSSSPDFHIRDSLILFTWADNSHTAPAYDNADIFSKWSSNLGASWNDSINLSNNPENSYRPRICHNELVPVDNAMIDASVIWFDYSTGNAEILSRRSTGIYPVPPLPVELTYFTADVNNGEILFTWKTSTETNNKGFHLQQMNSDSWEAIAFIPGYGTSSEPHTYNYHFVHSPNGKEYYRLVQEDFNGTLNILPMIEVNSNYLSVSAQLQQNYPNPFNPVTTIEFTITERMAVTLSIFDLLGKQVAVPVCETLDAGSYKIPFDASGLSSGVYFYQLTAGSQVILKKLLVTK